MNRSSLSIAISVLVIMTMHSPLMAQPAPITADTGWSELPQIPDPLGVAGPYIGVAGDSLIVAGGANFADGVAPGRAASKPGAMLFLFSTIPLAPGDTSETRLPRPLGYGVSITTPEGVWCIGGGDRERHYAEVFLLKFDGRELTINPQPSLPAPLANSCGALVGTRIVVAGGLESPTSTSTSKHVFSLDISAPPGQRKWLTHPSWPGPGRMLATAGGTEDSFYLFGGVDLKADAKGAARTHQALPQRDLAIAIRDRWSIRLDSPCRPARIQGRLSLARPVRRRQSPARHQRRRWITERRRRRSSPRIRFNNAGLQHRKRPLDRAPPGPQVERPRSRFQARGVRVAAGDDRNRHLERDAGDSERGDSTGRANAQSADSRRRHSRVAPIAPGLPGFGQTSPQPSAHQRLLKRLP